jgi:glucose-1-phosphatase
MHPRFIYFDMGRVLVNFSVERMLQQISDVSNMPVEKVQATVFDAGLMYQFEAGGVDVPEFYETFCKAIGSRPDFYALQRAVTEIFEVNLPVTPIAAQLRQAGYPMGILSNTCEPHWQYCSTHYRIVGDNFLVHALSCRLHAMKPDIAIFQAAADLAGYRPEEIFFVDDVAGHVAGAKAAGFDAVQYTTAAQLAADLRQRGVRFNY